MSNKTYKCISLALAAAYLGSSSLTCMAAPRAGISTVTVSTEKANVVTSKATPFAGINQSVADILSDALIADVEIVQDNEIETVEASEYADVAVAQVDNYVNVRSIPSEEGEVVGKLYNNSAATVLDEVDGWYSIISGDCTGFVKCEYVVVGDEELAKSVATRYATVNTETLFVRSGPSTDYTIIDWLPEGDDLVVIDESTVDQGWVLVNTENGDGYISLDYVTLSTVFTVAESKAAEEARLAKEKAERDKARAAAKAAEEARAAAKNAAAQAQAQVTAPGEATSESKTYASASGTSGSDVVKYGAQFVGNPYKYGGTSLTNGTDCSGFVQSVYSAFGVSLPRTSSSQRSVGYGVSYEEMQPGDIVCYSGHVGIYAGNGQLLHASTPSTGITYSPVTYRKILAIRRIF